MIPKEFAPCGLHLDLKNSVGLTYPSAPNMFYVIYKIMPNM